MKTTASTLLRPSSSRSVPVVASVKTGASASSSDLVEIARETRRNAEAFANTVRRFSEEMPDHLDRFHEAMTAFRRAARGLKS